MQTKSLTGNWVRKLSGLIMANRMAGSKETRTNWNSRMRCCSSAIMFTSISRRSVRTTSIHTVLYNIQDCAEHFPQSVSLLLSNRPTSQQVPVSCFHHVLFQHALCVLFTSVEARCRLHCPTCFIAIRAANIKTKGFSPSNSNSNFTYFLLHLRQLYGRVVSSGCSLQLK